MAATARAYPSEAALLSMTAPTLGTAPPSNDNWDIVYPNLEARLNALRTWRYSWWVHWSHLARLILPYRYHWVVVANSMNRGNPVNDAIVNNTATLAMRICASGMLSGLMSPSRPWFRFGLRFTKDGKIPLDARMWLDDAADRIYAVLSQSNFYNSAAQFCEDVSTFGTSPMIIYEDNERVIHTYVPCAGEYFLATGGRNEVNTLYREFVSTVSAIVGFFGLANCPEVIRTHWETGGASLEREFVVAHALEPNFPMSGKGRNNTGRTVRPVSSKFEYREVYWLRGQKTGAELRRKGFNEKPFMALRWSNTSNDAYGRGPGMDALGDSGQLQHEEVRKAEYIDKVVRPPMVGDAKLKNQPSSIRSGEITYVNGADGKDQFYPAYMLSPVGFAPLTADIEKVEKRIDRAFFVDVFLAITQMEGVQPREMLELQLRQSERIQRLGPLIENAETELGSAIKRITAIMQRRGMFLPMPASLKRLLSIGDQVNIEYVSVLKLMQQAAETAAMSGTAQFAGQMTEGALAAGLKAPIRKLKLDEFVTRYADRVGLPATLVYTDDETAAMDAAHDRAAAANQMGAAALPAVQAAEGLGKIDVGGGQNAVQALLGNGPGQSL